MLLTNNLRLLTHAISTFEIPRIILVPQIVGTDHAYIISNKVKPKIFGLTS